jgi:hypothetical protein
MNNPPLQLKTFSAKVEVVEQVLDDLLDNETLPEKFLAKKKGNSKFKDF